MNKQQKLDSGDYDLKYARFLCDKWEAEVKKLSAIPASDRNTHENYRCQILEDCAAELRGLIGRDVE